MNRLAGIVVAVVGLLVAVLGVMKVVPGMTQPGVAMILLGGRISAELPARRKAARITRGVNGNSGRLG